MMVYVILITYIFLTFVVSLSGVGSQKNTPESYFLADRGLKTIGLFFTILATNFSAFYFLGFAGEGYKIGYSHYTIMAFGTGLAALSIYLLGSRAWKLGKEHGYITPAELIYDQTKSRTLGYLYAAVMVIFTLPYLSLQIIGGGYLLENLTNGEIPYNLGVCLLTLFTIAYVLIGGMQSVAKTDLKQGLLVIILMFLGVVILSSNLGGLVEANQAVYKIKPELFTIEGINGHYTPQKWISFIVFWFFCIPMFPQLFIRFYIAKDLSHLKRSTILYGFTPLIISLFPVIIGVLGHLSFPGLVGKESDQILPMMLMEHTTDWFAALVMTGAIAAFMSTLDSQLLAMSTIFARDFYRPLINNNLSFKKEVAIGRVMVAIFALIGLFIAFNPFATIFDMGKLAFGGLAVLFPMTYAILRKGGVDARYGIASIVVGELLLIAFYYDWLPDSILMGFESFMLVIVVSSVIVFMGNRVKKLKN
jgi:SSS family solute:Na+ symporter